MKRFLCALVAMVICGGLGTQRAAFAAEAAAVAPPRGNLGGRLALVLDPSGRSATLLQSLEGGTIHAPVVEQQTGGVEPNPKHLGNVEFDDFVVTAGFGVDDALAEWIRSMLNGQLQRRSGKIVALSFDNKVIEEREFTNAVLTEVTIPALDAASKDAGVLRLRFAPEVIRYVRGDGSRFGPNFGKRRQQATSFRMMVDELPTNRVSKVQSFTIKRRLASAQIGETRDFEIVPGKLEIPNLTLTIAQADLPQWFDYFDHFVVRGEDVAEKSGFLSFLLSNLSDELFRIEFKHMGIFSLAPSSVEANSDKAASCTVELYVEEMKIVFTPVSGAM